ncbi:hypothetical protein WA026_013246 [Henosepilachna vigintioctopunctata]|uniref:Uncharacterized protein n=1 Tax=Henosepilachna vigintioctopunctata TaxID=420089 RepID=A0AAW1UJP6_9CUCU
MAEGTRDAASLPIHHLLFSRQRQPGAHIMCTHLSFSLAELGGAHFPSRDDNVIKITPLHIRETKKCPGLNVVTRMGTHTSNFLDFPRFICECEDIQKRLLRNKNTLKLLFSRNST